MLQAKSNGGEIITLATLSKEEIDVQRKVSQFHCPTCKEPVIIKAGQMVVPHFAHKSKVNCPSNEGGEGPYHEKGKLLLYQWLKLQHLQVELEVYLKEIKQQPDLLLKINNRRIAIEFQCARISINQIQARNAGYQKIGIIPIWILGANQFQRKGQYHLKIDQFTSQFMHQFSASFPLKLFYFCPDAIQLTTFQNIYLTKTKLAIGKPDYKKLENIRFTDLFLKHEFTEKELYELWKKEKKKFRLQPRNHLYGKEREWQQWLYLKQTHLEYLPSIIYLPISEQYKMNTPLWNWQSRLCIEVINPLPLGAEFSINRCEFVLRNHFHQSNHFPLAKSTVNPINQYLYLLEQLKLIKQRSPHHFIKINPIEFHQHIEQSINSDTLIMNELIISSKNKI